ncbi:MAG: hypothetical protein FWH04_06520 [Oscillospiraceae bacterium]|nr:hypothetical protein [Oscillospiraceae bacterium]
MEKIIAEIAKFYTIQPRTYWMQIGEKSYLDLVGGAILATYQINLNGIPFSLA